MVPRLARRARRRLLCLDRTYLSFQLLPRSSINAMQPWDTLDRFGVIVWVPGLDLRRSTEPGLSDWSADRDWHLVRVTVTVLMGYTS